MRAFSASAGLAMLLLASGAVQAVKPHIVFLATGGTIAGIEPRKDRILLRQVGATMVVEIFRVTGIGGMKLQPPTGSWPAAVVVHLHNFPHLESFTARGADSELDCGLTRPEGVPPHTVCRLGGELVDALQRRPGQFEVTLPLTLLDSGNPVELHWVDQWR